jgi:phenylpropionate dioxygenase-like ring-hydroxylating dioxygenase large terminal subunit
MEHLATLQQHWYVVCQAKELRGRPLERTMLGRPLALFRDDAGRPGALEDRCPHRNAPLSQGRVQAGRLVCPYHGWEFDGGGVCRHIPGRVAQREHATCNAGAYPALEQDGLIWVYAQAGAATPQPPARIVSLARPGQRALIRAFALEGALVDCVENFLDPLHTHFVHSRLVRTEGARRQVGVTVRRAADRVEAEYREERQSGTIARLFGAAVDRSYGRFILPATVELEYRAGAQVLLTITLFFTPETEARQRVTAVVAGSIGRLARALLGPLLQPLLRAVVRQDARILRLQRRTIERFGGPRYTSTELDLMRPHILRLLRGTPAHGAEEQREQEVLLLL